jgi:aryl-phospho-beta-D-glucosidase BglC (GH1 family)
MRSSTALLALCLLAACAGSGDPPAPTQTPTAAVSATPSRTATVTATVASSPPTATVPPAPSATATRSAPPTATVTPPASATATPTTTPSSTPSDTPTSTPTLIPTLEPLEIRADAEWIRDAQGRIVILRGANYSGLEFGNFIGNRNGPDESDFAQMERWGFNVIRLPFAWSFLEPAPNQFSDEHLHEQVDPVVDFAARHGIAVIPEMHQFFWSRCFTNGNGAPAWVCEGRGYTDDFAGAVRAGCDFIEGAQAPDGRTLQDHFVDVWRLVAHHFAGDRRVIALNFINEPHTYACTLDAPSATHQLYELYRRLRTVLREQGALQTLVIDPPVVRNLSIGIPTEPLGPDVVYAPHLYTQTFGLPELQYNGDASTITADYGLATSEAMGFGGPLFVGEYGGNTAVDGGYRAATELFLRDSLAEQDRRLIGGAVWAYFPSDNTFSVVDADGNEKGQLVNILARPYARRIAGVPTEMRFDVETREFVFSWRVEGAAPGGGLTEVFVPLRHYPEPFDIELSDGVAMRFDVERQILLLAAPEAGLYTLRLSP